MRAPIIVVAAAHVQKGRQDRGSGAIGRLPWRQRRTSCWRPTRRAMARCGRPVRRPYDATVKAALGVAPDDDIIGFIYLGKQVGGGIQAPRRPRWSSCRCGWGREDLSRAWRGRGHASAVRAALHRNRLPAAQLGLPQHRRIDAAHRPLPPSTSASSRPTCRFRAGSNRADAEAVCALSVTFGIFSSGLLLPGGSISSTSRPAWAIQLSSSALISAGFLHRRAAAGVDEDRRLLHHPEVLLRQHAFGLRRRRRVHRHEVGLRSAPPRASPESRRSSVITSSSMNGS